MSDKAFTFGKMNPVQTRNAINMILRDTSTPSEKIARRVSSYKNSPKVDTSTISHLKSYVNRYEWE